MALDFVMEGMNYHPGVKFSTVNDQSSWHYLWEGKRNGQGLRELPLMFIDSLLQPSSHLKKKNTYD